MSDKQMVLEVIAQLPDNVSLDEVREELDIITALRQARQASAEGRAFTKEEVAQILEQRAIRAAVEQSEGQIAAGNWAAHEDIRNRPAKRPWK